MMPRAEIRDVIRRLAMAVVPHLPRESQINFVASTISRESAKPVGAGTVKDWWYALDSDDRTVDSRHMDWARSRSRTMSANDNQPVRLPCLSEVIGWAA
jgi:hypothetical protein